MILNTSRLEISRFGFDDWHFFLRDPFASSAVWLSKQAMKTKRVIYKILAFKCAGKNERKNKTHRTHGEASITTKGCPGDRKETISNSLKLCQAQCNVGVCMQALLINEYIWRKHQTILQSILCHEKDNRKICRAIKPKGECLSCVKCGRF